MINLMAQDMRQALRDRSNSNSVPSNLKDGVTKNERGTSEAPNCSTDAVNNPERPETTISGVTVSDVIDDMENGYRIWAAVQVNTC